MYSCFKGYKEKQAKKKSTEMKIESNSLVKNDEQWTGKNIIIIIIIMLLSSVLCSLGAHELHIEYMTSGLRLFVLYWGSSPASLKTGKEAFHNRHWTYLVFFKHFSHISSVCLSHFKHAIVILQFRVTIIFHCVLWKHWWWLKKAWLLI